MGIIDPELQTKLRNLMALRERRDESKKEAEVAESEYREAEAELHEELAESGIKGGLKVDLGAPYGTVAFSPRETFYGRVLDYDAALEFFEKTAQVDEFTAPRIVKARVNELVRAYIEEGKPMPEGIDWYPKRYVAITRQKD